MHALAKSVPLYTLVNWHTADKDSKGWLCISPSRYGGVSQKSEPY